MAGTKNKLSDLRNHLFETIEALKDKETPMETERARAISDIAHAIINSAKVELRAAELMGISTTLLDEPAPQPAPKQLGSGPPDVSQCLPCRARKHLAVKAVRVVDGTPMCADCFRGKS